MRYLLDTHLLLWIALKPQRIPPAAISIIGSTDNSFAFSVCSIWETAIKRGLGRADFMVDPGILRRGLLENGYSELAITSDHAIGVTRLPLEHHDPFDRLLIAQAIAEDLVLLTCDKTIARYPGPIRKV